MVLSSLIFIYVSFFVLDKLIFGENADFPGTVQPSRAIDDKTQTLQMTQNQIPYVTQDYGCEPDYGKNIKSCGSNSEAEDSAKRSTVVLKPNRNARNVLTTAKPKTQNVTWKPSSQPRNATTKSTKSSHKNNTLKHRGSVVTAWPKPDKRLSGNRKAIANTKANQTSDGSITVMNFKSMYPTELWKEHGFYNDDYMPLINKYWFNFVPPSPSSHYIIGLVYAIMMVFGCFGNALVIFMYIKCKSLQTPANVLIMNLAVSDFFMLAKSPVIIYNSYYQGPAFGKWGCQLYGFVGGLTGIGSIMTLAAISLDRYYVIVHPLNAAVKTTKQRAHIWIALIWTYGFAFSIIPVLDLGYNRFVPEGYLTSCSFDYLTDDSRGKGFILVFFTAAWCVPFITMSFCYVKILIAVWMTSEMAASRFGQEEEKRKTEVRLGYVVSGVILLWFLSWTPYATIALLGVFDQKKYITPLITMIPAIFCKTASCMDPWIYAITHPRFKKELTKLLSRKKNRKLERDYGVKKSWEKPSNYKSGTRTSRQNSSTEDEDVDEVIVMVDPSTAKSVHRQGSTSSHKTEETMALETKFPPTRQESLKYMPPSWYKLPRTKSRSSIKFDAAPVTPTGENGRK